MRHLIILLVGAAMSIATYAKPHGQGFNNYDNKVKLPHSADS